MSWQIIDESCNINFKENGVSHRTLPKELIVLEIVLAGEALNDTSVDNVFVRYEGKYSIELPYNDTTIGATSYASAELLRAAIETLLDTNPCSGGGSPGGGSQAFVVTSGDFVLNDYTRDELTDLVPDVDFLVFSDNGSGTLLKEGVDYTFSGNVITIPSGPDNIRIIIL